MVEAVPWWWQRSGGNGGTSRLAVPAVECLQPEDVRWAAEESADGAAPFFAVFAETNALGVEDGRAGAQRGTPGSDC